jgi:hypothetical protein
VSPDDENKAQMLATRLMGQADLSNDNLGRSVQQNMASVGAVGDAGAMTDLVRKKLVDMGKLKALPESAGAAYATRYADILDQDEVSHAFETMMHACGFHESMATSIYRALCRDGVYERKLDRAQSLWFPEMWSKVHADCLPHFDVRPGAGEGENRTIVITLVP